MSDILKVAMGTVSYVTGWLVPTLVWLATMVMFVKPVWSDSEAINAIGSLVSGYELVAFATTAGVLAAIAWNLSALLYRGLEGYLFPGPLRTRRQRHWTAHLKLLEQQRRSSEKDLSSPKHPNDTRYQVNRQLLVEKIARFPANPQEVQATRLGNATRTLETYGPDRFRLDSLTLWNECIAVVPDSLRAQVARSRANVDFFVASTYLSLVAIAVFTASALRSASIAWLVSAAIGGCLAYGAYRAACVAVDGLRDSSRAVVNIARVPLAESLGLKMPDSLTDERDMWYEMSMYVHYPYKDTRELNKYRTVGQTAQSTPMNEDS